MHYNHSKRMHFKGKKKKKKEEAECRDRQITLSSAACFFVPRLGPSDEVVLRLRLRTTTGTSEYKCSGRLAKVNDQLHM